MHEQYCLNSLGFSVEVTKLGSYSLTRASYRCFLFGHLPFRIQETDTIPVPRVFWVSVPNYTRCAPNRVQEKRNTLEYSTQCDSPRQRSWLLFPERLLRLCESHYANKCFPLILPITLWGRYYHSCKLESPYVACPRSLSSEITKLRIECKYVRSQNLCNHPVN